MKNAMKLSLMGKSLQQAELCMWGMHLPAGVNKAKPHLVTSCFGCGISMKAHSVHRFAPQDGLSPAICLAHEVREYSGSICKKGVA
jgi:hypothetical protein